MEFVILIALAICALLFFVTCFVSYSLTFKNTKKNKDDPFSEVTLAAFGKYREHTNELIHQLLETPFEDVYIKSGDGVRLHGRYYHYADGAPFEIQLHGYRGHALRDFCSGARDAKNRRHNLLLIDQRAHGKSDGKAISFGIKESHDCIEWVKYLTGRFGDGIKIVLIGMSMGAATVLMASGLDLPDNVKGVMADCPYSSPKEIIKKVISEDLSLPASLLFPFVRLGGIIFGGFDIEESSPAEAVKKSKTPTLLIHGAADSFVPAQMSERIFDVCAAEQKRRLVIPDADHGLSYFTDKDTYLGAVDEFMNLIGIDGQ
jgi:fermentation-respiration switch protein FrsA (DUF1100 family)